MKQKKLEMINCIIDTDPGVDDSAAFILSLYDDLMNIRLITTVNGNLGVDIVTRNVLHLLEMYNRTDIPVAKGAPRPMNPKREVQNAIFAHREAGMGLYNPPETTQTKPIENSAVEAMYETCKLYAGNIVIIMQGPATNVGQLLATHPDVKDMITHIYYEGCSAWDTKMEGVWKNYRSFNASSDPEALKLVVESGIPLTMVPSRMGRDLAFFTEQEVMDMEDINDTGKFIYTMYTGYWERNYADRRVATNDTLAVLAMRFPKLFKTKRATVEVDTGFELPGKTVFNFNRKGHIEYAYKVNKKKMHQLYFSAISKLTRFDLDKYLADSEMITMKNQLITLEKEQAEKERAHAAIRNAKIANAEPKKVKKKVKATTAKSKAKQTSKK